MGTSSPGAFARGAEFADQAMRERRQRKEALSDEERQYKFADLFHQRENTRARLQIATTSQNKDPNQIAALHGELANIQLGMEQLYHPIHAPGALQKDWQWLTGLITRRKPATPDVVPTANDVSVSPGAQSVTLGATDPYVNNHKMLEPGTPAQQITLPAGPNITLPGTTQTPTSETMAKSGKVKGLVAPGNIPIWNRPIVQNDDGTHSSELSTSFVDGRPESKYYGKEVLVPVIADGKFLTPDGKKPEEGTDDDKAMKEKAWERYKATGQHLGVFDNAKDANKYAEMLHNRGQKPQPTPASYVPKQSSYERKVAAQREKARTDAEQYAAGAPLSPEEEARAKVDSTMSIADSLMGADWDEDDRERFKQSLIYGALGTGVKEKFYPQLATTKDAAGKEHYYRVPMEPGRSPEEVDFNGQTLVPKGAAKVGMKYDTATGQVVEVATGKRFSQGDPTNPPEVQAMFAGADKITKAKQDYMKELAGVRGSSYNDSKVLTVYDTANGNKPDFKKYSEMQKEPGRYIPISGSDKAIAAVNLMEDLKGTSQLTRDAILNLKEDFPIDMKLKIATALTAEDHGISFNALTSELLGTLSDDQWQFLVRTRQLAENAMSLRQILGAGQGSEDVRTAIQATLPNLLTPNRKFALMQLDAFDQTLERLHRGTRNVQLNTKPWSVQDKPGGAGNGGAGKRRQSVSAAVANWAKAGVTKTPEQVTAEMKSLGIEPLP